MEELQSKKRAIELYDSGKIRNVDLAKIEKEEYLSAMERHA